MWEWKMKVQEGEERLCEERKTFTSTSERNGEVP